MGDRYFPVTALGGRQYFDDAEGLVYTDEAVVDMLVTRVGRRKAQTEAELLGAVGKSARTLPSLRVWVREGLEALAGRVGRVYGFLKAE